MVKNAVFILEDDKRLKKFKDAAFAKAEEFSIDKIVPMYETLLRSDFRIM